MTVRFPEGDLARAKTHEAETDWPGLIEIVAWYGKGGRSGSRKSLVITEDQFFGRGAYGAPLTGDQIIAMIHQLRKQS